MDIEKIARLARLKLTDEEKMKFEKDLAEILEAFRVLDEMKTKERPALHPIDIKNELRADEAEPGLTQEEILSKQRNREGPYFKGPRV